MSDAPKKILIVDDEKPMASALQMKLTHSGFEAKVAYDGVQALEMIQAEKFDLVLLDLIMPRMDGFSVLSEVEKKGIKTPIVVSSNLGQAEDMDRARQLGAVDYFVKSDTSIAEIVEKVRKNLQEHAV